ncbi:MAG: hypothetical protein ACT6QS_01755 [Flavobacteriales bacterium]
MKRLFNLLMIISLCLPTLHAQQQRKGPVEISIAHTEPQAYICTPGISHISLEVTLHNSSADTTRFWLMNCSVSDNFCTDNPGLDLCTEFCWKNNPHILQLAPGEKMQVGLSIFVKDPGKDNKFRIGYYHVDRSEAAFGELHKVLDQKKNNRIKPVWSNTLTSIP